VNLISNVGRLVSDSCAILLSNEVLADVVHSAKIRKQTGREVSQGRPGTWLLVCCVAWLYYTVRAQEKREKESVRGSFFTDLLTFHLV
jgi:hypothetical protein